MRRIARLLRLKPALAFFIAIAVVLGVVLFAILVLAEAEVNRRFDRRLSADAAAIADKLQHTEGSPAGLAAPGSAASSAAPPVGTDDERSGLYYQIATADGTVIERSAKLGELLLPLPITPPNAGRNGAPVLSTVQGTTTQEAVARLGKLRIATVTRQTRRGTRYVQVAQETGDLRELLVSLRWALGGGFLIGLLPAAVVSRLLARHSVAPVTRMAELARKINSGDFTLRFEQPGGPAELSALVATLNAMLDRIREAMDSQERFISDVAHELKTPLAVMLSEAQVLMQQDRTPEEYARFVNSIQDEARALAEVIESLLTLARAQAGQPLKGVSDLPLNDIVLEAVSRMTPYAEQRQVRLVAMLHVPGNEDPIPSVRGDGPLLTLMLTNLLRNAVRYSPTDGAVDVSVAIESQEATIIVRDRGPGIPQEYVSMIFEPFFRVPDRGTDWHGVGLGLAIVRGAARLHGGSVRASNHPQGGAEFTVKLPLAASV